MDPILVVGIALLTLLIGCGLGWLLSAKVQDSTIAAASSTAEDLRRTLDGVNTELNQAKEHYSTARDEREALAAKLAAKQAEEDAAAEAAVKQAEAEAQEKLEAEFEAELAAEAAGKSE